MSSLPLRRLNGLCLMVAASLSIGSQCHRGGIQEGDDAPTAEELVSYYSPRTIKVLPFTKPRSFDEDIIPDGIGVSLRPLDAAGDPVKAYGEFLFELYAYRPAISHHRGDRLQIWTQPVLNADAQKQFWDGMTNAYEFQLSWEGKPLSPDNKYILVASFQAPGSERLEDEYEFEFRVVREEILKALAEQN